MRRGNEIQILVGNIASGKSTYCKKHFNDFIILSCDALRYMIGADHYIYNVCLEPILQKAILDMYVAFQICGKNIIIDETNVSMLNRKLFIKKKKLGYRIKAIVFPRLDMKKSVMRRLCNNHGNTKQAIWEDVWNRFDSRYEEPMLEEGFDEIIYLRE